MPPIQLENAHLRATIDPNQGTSLRSFQVHRNNTWLPLMPEIDEPGCDLAAASFLMVPYSNRIADGSFTFAGECHQLQNGEQHAIHGDVRKRAWHVEEQQPHRLICSFSSAEYNDINWPWPFAVRAEYELTEHTLQQRLTLSNRADRSMPAGCGWHPFFNRTLTQDGEPAHLHFQVQSAYPDGYDNRIPSGPTQALALHQDFTGESPLAPDNFLDTCFYGYDGQGHIAWPKSGVRLRFACSNVCSHLILYNPAQKPYFAVEPVTNANDGVNLYARGNQTSGIAVLEPGQSLNAEFSLHVECS